MWGEGEESIGRSVSRELDLVCRWEGCGKVCLSKEGLTLHQKRVQFFYAFPSSGDACRDRQLTTNFELKFFVCRHVSK